MRMMKRRTQRTRMSKEIYVDSLMMEMKREKRKNLKNHKV